MLVEQKENIRKRFGEEITVQAILVKDISKSNSAFNKTAFLTENFYDLLEDPEISILVDLTDSGDDSFSYLSEGFKAGKHAVTSNHTLIAKHLEDLSKLAVDNEKAFLYGACLGGGINIVKSILDDSQISEITHIKGILDGPCNVILSKLDEDNKLEDILKNNDKTSKNHVQGACLDGLKTKKEATIITSLAFSGQVKEEDIACFGISNIDHDDLQIMKELDSSVKLMADGAFKDGKYFATIMPTFVKKTDIFSQVKSNKNIISYEGNKIDQVTFIGPDGSILSTASAVVRDLVDIVAGSYQAFNPLTKGKITISNQDMEGYFYIRINKKYEKIFDGLYEEKTDLFDKVFIITKKIKFGIILDLVKNLDKKDFFLARILKD